MERTVNDIPEMYSEMMILMKHFGKEEQSRNGPVLSMNEPLTVTVKYPIHRVLTDPIRNANPFFHLMEFVWMMGGYCTADWIRQFNKRFVEYADDDGIIHGAYGYRWRYQFQKNQILHALDMLNADPTTRRVVLAMWDAEADLNERHNDLPCNTHIYLRICGFPAKLDMTVCNRSNDVIWGMTGANAVHMTLLQELMANELGIPMGAYRVFTNNAHIYKDLPNMEKMLLTHHASYPLNEGTHHHVPLLAEGERADEFMQECGYFVCGRYDLITNNWLKTVAKPVYELWFNRDKDNWIQDTSWAKACTLWLQRKSQ